MRGMRQLLKLMLESEYPLPNVNTKDRTLMMRIIVTVREPCNK